MVTPTQHIGTGREPESPAHQTTQREAQKQRRLAAFEQIKRLRRKITVESGGKLPDPVEDLRQLREGRDQHIMDVVRGC